VGPRAGLDGRKISSPPRFDPGPSSPYSVAIPTELPGPHYNITFDIYRVGKILRPPYDEEPTLPRNVVFRLRSVAVSCRRTETSAIPLGKPDKGIVIVFWGFPAGWQRRLDRTHEACFPVTSSHFLCRTLNVRHPDGTQWPDVDTALCENVSL